MQRFKNILCVVAREASADALVARAAALAQRNGAQLTVAMTVPELTRLQALPGRRALREQLQTALIRAADTQLARLVEPHAERLSVSTEQLSDTPFLAIIRKVLRDGHDLVIKAPEDPHWSDQLLGTDDMHLMRKCPCPVWMHRPSEHGGYRRIVAAIDSEVDGEDAHDPAGTRQALNKLVFDLASSMALAEGATLYLVHAWEAIGEGVMRGAFATVPEEQIADHVADVMRQNQAAAEEFLAQMESGIGRESVEYLQPITHLVKGYARDVIPESAEKIGADLVVMGTVARTGIPGYFIGNTAETALSRLNCSVLAVKPPGFKSPVE